MLESTAGDDFPMGPGKTYVAQTVWGSVFLDYLSRYFLIPSCNINAISEAYERHLRKPQNASFPNQYLQEQGGETTASLSSAIYMADSSSSNEEQALVIVVPVGLPPELHQCVPEYFLVVDSGATVHSVLPPVAFDPRWTLSAFVIGQHMHFTIAVQVPPGIASSQSIRVPQEFPRASRTPL